VRLISERGAGQWCSFNPSSLRKTIMPLPNTPPTSTELTDLAVAATARQLDEARKLLQEGTLGYNWDQASVVAVLQALSVNYLAEVQRHALTQP
jgi:hypothetical protein